MLGCTSAGFPDRFMPFEEPARLGVLAARGARFTYGPLLRRLRERKMQHTYEREPAWRRPSAELQTGYESRW